MSDLLSIGASGVRAFNTALTAIGSNVSNAETPGYTRRTVSLAEGAGGSGAAATFNGVTVDGIGRAADDYTAAAARNASSDAGRAASRATWLSAVETDLNDTATGIGQTATAFFSAASALSANPSSTANRQTMLSALGQTVQAFNSTAATLKTTADGIASAAGTSVAQINASLDQLAKINSALAGTKPGTSGAADLADQRDAVLNTIGAQVGVDVSIAANGVATVKLGGSGTDLTAGARLGMTVADNGGISITAAGKGVSQTVTGLNGTLGGLVESAGVVADRRASLDAMASSFASAVNGWQAQGRTAAGTAGAALLSGNTAAGLAVTTSDPAAIAAASTDGTANGNLLALPALRGADGVEKRWSALVSDQGLMVQTATSESNVASARADSTAATRDAASAVDLDTEAAELVRYQQAYSGAAKVIQVARDTMQSILDLF